VVEIVFEGACPTCGRPTVCVDMTATAEQMEELSAYAAEARQAGHPPRTITPKPTADTALLVFQCPADHCYSLLRNAYGDWVE
jgi:hypothetical protein